MAQQATAFERNILKSQVVISRSIEQRIWLIRGKAVILDFDVAQLYGVLTKRLNEQVRRNARRFPNDFAFRLTTGELANWRSQFATSNSFLRLGLRRPPTAFTEQGVAMLSSVLNSEQAINVNIAIMRAFVNVRRLSIKNAGFDKRLDELEKKHSSHDKKLKLIFAELRAMREFESADVPARPIGFRSEPGE